MVFGISFPNPVIDEFQIILKCCMTFFYSFVPAILYPPRSLVLSVVSSSDLGLLSQASIYESAHSLPFVRFSISFRQKSVASEINSSVISFVKKKISPSHNGEPYADSFFCTIRQSLRKSRMCVLF